MRRYASAGLVAVILIAVGATSADAQVTTRNFRSSAVTGLGYSGALPGAEIGAGAFHFFRSGIGVFANAHLTSGSTQDHINYCPQAVQVCDVSWVQTERNDFHMRDKDEWLAINAGGILALTNELAVMLGGGAARATRYVEFLDEESDPALRITPEGTYYVDDAAGSGWKPQVVAGALFRAGRSLALSAGYETAIGTAAVGVYLMF